MHMTRAVAVTGVTAAGMIVVMIVVVMANMVVVVMIAMTWRSSHQKPRL